MKSEMLERINSFFSVSPKYRFVMTIIAGLVLGVLQLKALYLLPIAVLMLLILRLNIVALALGILVTYRFSQIQPIPFLVQESFFYKSLLAGLIVGVIFLFLFTRINKTRRTKFLNLFRMVYRMSDTEAGQRFVFYDSTAYRWVLFKVFIFTFLTVFLILISWSTFNLSINPLTSAEDELYKTKRDKVDKVFGFYLINDKNSKDSFEEYGGSLDILIPEWYSFDEQLNLKADIRLDVDQLANDYEVKEMPLVKDLVNEKFLGKISNQELRKKIIDELFQQVKQNKYKGITIDFRIDKIDNEELLLSFMSELYKKFNNRNKKVAYVVSSKLQLANSAKFADATDYIILKLYNEPNELSGPQPIAPQNWVKETLGVKRFPEEKLVISFANFGYESVQDKGIIDEKVTFNEVMGLCGEENQSVMWDSSYNNPYVKFSKGGENHTIWFLDAATMYNQLNMLAETEERKVAIWPLGYEDPAVWDVLSNKKNKKLENLRTIKGSKDINYVGKGELLRISSDDRDGLRDFAFDNKGFITNEAYSKYPSRVKVERYGKSQDKVVVLTFDDGPDPTYTPQILDVLDKYKTKATFFVVGKNAELYPEIVRQMYDSGHEVGNHTYSHPDLDNISSSETEVDLNANQRIIQEITGHSTMLFRTPYSPEVEYLTLRHLRSIIKAQEMGYTTVVGATIDPRDWKKSNSDEIVNSIVNQLPLGNIILLHDSGGDRTKTVEALPKIIENLGAKGYKFVTVSSLMGKSREDIMPKANGSQQGQYDHILSRLVAYLRVFAFIILTLGTVLVIVRFIIILKFSFRNKMRVRYELGYDYMPSVSIIVPAYNEQKVICKTVRSLLESSYDKFEVIVVDDGSTDSTEKVVREQFKGVAKVRVLTKPNGGKSSAINLGIQKARGEVIITVDADTVVDSQAIRLLAKHFVNPEVAAVGGNIKVGNVHNVLTIWQYIEYVNAFNFEKRAYDELNCITVVPGALGAWRKSAIMDVGYFDDDTLAEDTEMTIRLSKKGYKIKNEQYAYCYTEAPQDVKSLLKQRYRWTYGTLQCLWKHRDAIFNRKHKALGLFALPSMLIFQYIFYPIAAITELIFYISVLNGWVGGNNMEVLLVYALLVATSIGVAVYSFILEKANFKYLLLVIPMYIFYRMLIASVVIKSIIFSIKGEIIGWNKLKRQGNVMGKG